MEPTITSLVRMGLTHAEIAERLGVSERHVTAAGPGAAAGVSGRLVAVDESGGPKMSRAVAVAIAECGCAAGGAAGAAGPIGAVLVAVLGIAAAGAVVVAAAYAVMAIVAAVALLVALAAATAVIAAAGAALTVGGVHLARLCRARWDATAAAVEAAPVTVRVEMVHSMDGTTRLRALGTGRAGPLAIATRSRAPFALPAAGDTGARGETVTFTHHPRKSHL